MNGWNEFLEARMLVIRDALKQGKTLDEINHLVGVSPMQLMLLCETGRMRNEEELRNAHH